MAGGHHTPGRAWKGHRAPCPPSPSHHAILGGSALLHGVFKQHVTLGVTETHPARPAQPASTSGVSRGRYPPFPPPHSAPGTGVHRRGHAGVTGGLGRAGEGRRSPGVPRARLCPPIPGLAQRCCPAKCQLGMDSLGSPVLERCLTGSKRDEGLCRERHHGRTRGELSAEAVNKEHFRLRLALPVRAGN